MSKTQDFIGKAQAIHGDRWDYSEVVYTRCNHKVKIGCQVHGIFEVTPNAHLSQKTGCPKCSGKYKPTTEEFIQMCKEVHGDLYDYSNVEYKNNYTKIRIICPTHGEFAQRPQTHLKGGGCLKCAHANAGSYHKKTTDQFIKEAVDIHGDKYTYDNVVYTNIHTKVKITCPKHGDFEQTPASHVKNGNGCPICSVQDYQGGYGFKRFRNHPEIKDNPATLYLIQVDHADDDFIKIGITQKELSERFNKGRIPFEYSTINTWSGKLYDLFLIEQQIKKQFTKHKHRPNAKFDGHTECFVSDVVHDVEDAVQRIMGA